VAQVERTKIWCLGMWEKWLSTSHEGTLYQPCESCTSEHDGGWKTNENIIQIDKFWITKDFLAYRQRQVSIFFYLSLHEFTWNRPVDRQYFYPWMWSTKTCLGLLSLLHPVISQSWKDGISFTSKRTELRLSPVIKLLKPLELSEWIHISCIIIPVWCLLCAKSYANEARFSFSWRQDYDQQKHSHARLQKKKYTVTNKNLYLEYRRSLSWDESSAWARETHW